MSDERLAERSRKYQSFEGRFISTLPRGSLPSNLRPNFCPDQPGLSIDIPLAIKYWYRACASGPQLTDGSDEF
jgi:hypothetical protein